MAGIGHRGFMGRKKEPVGLPFIFSVTVGSGQSFQLPTINSGTYDAIIDWGDGGSDVLTVWDSSSRNHTYTSAGTYDITISGLFNGWSVNNYADRLKITEIKQWGGLLLGTGAYAFYGCSNMTISATDILDTSNCTSFVGAFKNCSSISTVPNMGNWIVSNVTVFGGTTAVQHGCFEGCTSFNEDISGWNVSGSNNFFYMFRNCSSFNQDLDWDVSNGVNFSGMFWGASSFNGDISGWNVSSAQVFYSIFRGGTNFNSDISGWNTISLTNLYQAFDGAQSFNADISGWNTSLLTSLRFTFRNAYAFDRDLSSWFVESVTDFTGCFQNVTLSTTNYDALLNGWASQTVISGRSFHGGNSKYSPTGLIGRNILTGTYGWTITDGGAA